MDFEKLDVWRRSSRLCCELYKALNLNKDYGFKDQITRSAVSIPSNIAEGMERTSHREKLKFLGYAKGSCGELRTQMYIGLEIGYLDRKTGKYWLNETREISSMLTGLMKTIAKESN